MVLEGVHLVPGMVPAQIEGAMVVHSVLAIENEDVHASNFWIRDAASEGLRPVDKYLEALRDIRVVQDYIIDRAAQTGVPVIDNVDLEHAVGAVIELTLASAERLRQTV